MTFRISLVYKLSRRLRIDLRNNRSPRSTDYARRNTAKISSIPASRVQEIPDIVMDLMELRCTTDVYREGGVTLHKSAQLRWISQELICVEFMVHTVMLRLISQWYSRMLNLQILFGARIR